MFTAIATAYYYWPVAMMAYTAYTTGQTVRTVYSGVKSVGNAVVSFTQKVKNLCT